MALEIEGKIVKKLPEVKGEGKNGPWRKQEFILETFGEYPKKICFNCWNDKVADLNTFSDGYPVKVNFSPESREYNERWYTELRAYKIEGIIRGGVVNASPENVQAPAAKNNPTQNVAPVASAEEAIGEEEDDLPF